MNRAFPALGLLLGTLAAALVAAGVARDLERAGTRPSSPTVDSAKHVSTLVRPVSMERSRIVDWKSWTKQLLDVPQPAPLAKKPSPPIRLIVDFGDLVALPVRNQTNDTATVDALIRANDGIDDIRETDVVPFGHVLVGGRLVKLDHHGRRLEVGEAWTGRLHYESDRRQTLARLDPATALSHYRVAPLPGDKLLLWSDDCRALIGWTNDAACETLDRFVRALGRTEDLVTLVAWTRGGVNKGWAQLANHVKRQAWLATLPPLPDTAPVQSAQRLRGGKR